jgi:hypothetical protein
LHFECALQQQSVVAGLGTGRSFKFVDGLPPPARLAGLIAEEKWNDVTLNERVPLEFVMI